MCVWGWWLGCVSMCVMWVGGGVGGGGGANESVQVLLCCALPACCAPRPTCSHRPPPHTHTHTPLVIDVDIRWAGQPDVVMQLSQIPGATLGLSTLHVRRREMAVCVVVCVWEGGGCVGEG